MPRRFGLLIVGVCLFLASCASQQPIIQYKEVKVPVYKYVAVPAKYTTHDKTIPEPKDDYVNTALIIANQRKAKLQVCYKQLDDISFIQGSDSNGGP